MIRSPPTQRQARLRVAWRDYKALVDLFLEYSPDDLWGAADVMLAAVKQASGLKGLGTAKGPRGPYKPKHAAELDE